MLKESGMDFRHKEVVNINNGKRLGFVQDVCANLETGRITSIIVPGGKKLMSMFAKEDDIVVMSPASASFDMYKNFEERGNHFKRLVGKL